MSAGQAKKVHYGSRPFLQQMTLEQTLPKNALALGLTKMRKGEPVRDFMDRVHETAPTEIDVTSENEADEPQLTPRAGLSKKLIPKAKAMPQEKKRIQVKDFIDDEAQDESGPRTTSTEKDEPNEYEIDGEFVVSVLIKYRYCIY